MKYKKNHYIPAFHLRSFSIVQRGNRNPMLWVYDKVPKEPRKQSPKDTAAINDLYGISAPGVRSTDLEVAFSKHESSVAPILAKWQKPRTPPSIDEIPEVAYFLALLHLRNPKMAKFSEALLELMAAEKSKAVVRDDAKFDKFWEYLVARDGPPQGGLTKAKFRELALNFDDHFKLQVHPKHATIAPLLHAGAVHEELKQMYWCLCFAPEGWNFITCDSPVVVRFRSTTGLGFGLGFGHPTAQVTFPISPRVCLYLSRSCRLKTTVVDSTFVKNANRRTAINAERFVFASELSEGIEELVKKYSYTRMLPRLNKPEVIESIRKNDASS